MRNIQIYLTDKKLCRQEIDGATIEYNELITRVKNGQIFHDILRYDSLELLCNNFFDLPMPFLSLCICRLLCRGKCAWIDKANEKKRITIFSLFPMAVKSFSEHIEYRSVIKKIKGEIDELSCKDTEKKTFSIIRTPLYLRLDLTFGIVAGGSVGHISGVLNNLGKYGPTPIFITTDVIPTVTSDIKTIMVDGYVPYRNVSRVSALMGNLISYPIIEQTIRNNDIGFIYQRSGLNIYAGVKAAIEYNLPYVLEYNGSEIWCEEHWGNNQLRYVDLAKKIERLTFEKADLITCVSRPLKEQLVEMGIQADKIMVNPNGVDPDKYRPDIDGRRVRKKYGIEEAAIVIGFIGTFGAWHGAELLASAYVNVVKRNKNIHLLMIGDGLKLSEVKENLQELDPSQYTLTGLIPQVQGPEYLAACDILVNPTVPNPDGTPFFGSPTKLFEYMAMGKAVVASGMDQMQEVLEQGRTALLVEPGNVLELEEALNKLVEDKELRRTLGINARKQVCEHYTWEIHTKKIIDKLIEIMER